MHKKAKKKMLRKEFNSKDKIWRIEAVIHDGNWYDKPKWKKVSRVEEKDLDKWIKENKDVLIKSDEGSYRVDYDEVVRWYDEQEIDIEESIIPNNFPPKLWTKQTETDIFLNAPRRRVGTVSFVIEQPGTLQKCVQILRGTAKIMPDKLGRYKAYGLSAIHMKNLLSKGLDEKEFNSLDLKTRAVLKLRELADLPDEWIEEAVDFYSNVFAPNALRSSMSTISIYLPDGHDIHAQTVIWVIRAIKKFNEEASVPFAGYLSSVLRHWPYNLPDEQLGKELSKFQRDRKRAIDMAIDKGHSNDNVPIEVIAEIMDMPLSQYISLTNEHETWLAEKNATTLKWQDSANEKKGSLLIGQNKRTKADKSAQANLSLAAVKAAVDSKRWESAYLIIDELDKNDISKDLGENLNKDFLIKFKKHLDEINKG